MTQIVMAFAMSLKSLGAWTQPLVTISILQLSRMKGNARTLQVTITIVMGIALTTLMETAFVMNSLCMVVRTLLPATTI